MFIGIGLALYSLRRIRIIRAIGTIKSDDALRVVYKRVFNFQVEKPKVLLDMSDKNLLMGTDSDSSIHLHQESFHDKR